MDRLDTLRAQAQELDRSGLWKAAAAVYRQICESGEAGFWDHHNLATATLYAGDLPEAAALIGKLAALGSNPAAVAVLRASLAERRGQSDLAEQEWTRARDLGASAYWTRFGQARALCRSGKLRLAQEAMRAALLENDAEDGGLRFALDVDLKLLDYGAAESKFDRLRTTAAARESAVLSALPGMTWPQERAAVCVAACEIAGNGQIVDLGSFLGSLTAAMAAGLSRNERARRRGVLVHAFDQFVWQREVMDGVWGDSLPGPPPEDGDSFRHLFDHVTVPWKDLIHVHAGDLLTQRWSDPIELLSIDAMKSPALTRRIVAEFLPRVLCGASVFHQDFCFDATWWIHIYHYVLRTHFEIIDRLPGAAGMMFRLVSPVTQDEVRRALDLDLGDTKIADEAFALSLRLAAPEDRHTIAAAHIRYYAEMQPHSYVDRIRQLEARYAGVTT